MTVISVEDLRKEYGDVVAVDDVSLQIEEGTVLGILGPNGAGKTTLIKMILGLIEPTSGHVEVAGHSMNSDQNQAHQHIGVMLEGARNVYWRLTVMENLSFFARIAGKDPANLYDRHENLLRKFSLYDKKDVNVKDISRGMKQKVALVCALAQDNDIVFLDEPTLGLDISSSLQLRSELRRLVDEESMTVILTSHDMDVIAELCDQVLILDNGNIVAFDEVDSLVDIFRTNKYRIRIDDSVPEQISHWDSVSTSADETYTTMEITDEDGAELHELLGLLLEHECRIESIESVEPDLADAFLNITSEKHFDGQEATGDTNSLAKRQ